MSTSWPVGRAAPESVGLSPQRLANINRVMRENIEAKKIAGGITAVLRKNKLAHLECHGLMNLDRCTPMREDALFRIYSMTKIVTSVAVLMLFEEGKFLLTEPVKRWLPAFADIKVAAKGADGREETVRPRRDVLVHDLLTHMAGLSYDLVHDGREAGWTLQQLVDELCKRPLKRHPGEAWDYSAATDILGRFVEVVSGEPFETFLKRRIFEPLGMVDTDFWVPPEKAQRLAEVYTPGEDGKLIPATDIGCQGYLQDRAMKSGGGGLVSTTADYMRFSLALLNGGQWDGVRLLSRKTVDLMTADHLPPGHPPVEVTNRRFGFGLGVSVLRTLGEGRQLGSVGEYGWGGAAATQVWIDPAESMITMIMMQFRAKEPFYLMDLFKTMAYGAIVD